MSCIFTITKPNDLHVHFRDDERSALVIDHTTKQCGRAIIMPNLMPPVITKAMANKYQSYIESLIPAGREFKPMMTLYLTDNTTVQDVIDVSNDATIFAFKLYPAGATTNSDSGVTSLKKIAEVLSALEEHGVRLLLHGEVTASDIDIFDRERIFVETKLTYLHTTYPALKMVSEHITTKESAEFVSSAPDHICATITPQHLLVNRNEIFAGNKIRPHNFCLPILKAEEHRQALITLATSGSNKVFAGTDSAPHPRSKKECCCGNAGCYTACNAIELYAEAFHREADLTKPATQKIFENFMSFNGASFYGIEPNTGTTTISKQEMAIPAEFTIDGDTIVPFWAEKTIGWSVI